MNKILPGRFVGCVFVLFLFFIRFNSLAFIPHPDHVVVLILENTSYSEIIGSPSAPYINGLLSDSKCALFTQSYGMSRPSQPNYLQLFSGSAQGVTTNNLPAGIPFTTPNLGAQLLAASKTFIGYSESMPYAGYTGEVSGNYARKHNPWVNWQGSPMNEVPAALNETFLAFPNSSNYHTLPDLSIVVPNQDNDMHNGTLPQRVSFGDAWVQNNMDAYIQWAKTHNSLFILTFDEDDFFDQHIVTLFVGPMVNPGSYSNYINHYSLLGLLEDMFFLPRIAGAVSAAPIDYCWKPCYQNSLVTANGPLSFCQGGNVTLTATGSGSYLWSTGAVTQSITVNATGNYTVTVNDGAGCISTSSPVKVSVNGFEQSNVVFSESMGSTVNTVTIASHETANGFDNDLLLMSGTGDVRGNVNSTNYANASGGANIFLNTNIGRNFLIQNINTSGLAGLQLSFGINKSNLTSTGNDLLVQYSTDGVNFTSLSFDPLPVADLTSRWYFRIAAGTIPAVSNLRIRFYQSGTTSQYRIDDVQLKYTMPLPQISASGPVSFCSGNSVVLSSTFASAYLWSNNATTPGITVTTSGNYSVVATGSNGCTATSNMISVSVIIPPVLSAFNPISGSPGTTVIIDGSGFTGTTQVTFGGIPATFQVISSNQISALVSPGSVSGLVAVTNSCGQTSSVQSFTVINSPSVLQLKLFIEGYYQGGGQMTSALGGYECDTVTVELRSQQAPHSLMYSMKTVVNIQGQASVTFPSSANGYNFYVVVYGHNSLLTWSKESVIFRSNTPYDFTLAATQAYGNNLKNLGDGNFALFSGDVTADGQINGSDHAAILGSLQNFDSGYHRHDLTGDSIVESADFSVLDNNLNINAIRP